MKRRRSPRRSGMTLVELVVALAISGLVMTSGYAAFSTMADRRATATTVIDDVARAAAIRATLAAWVTGAELTIEDDAVLFRGLDGVRNGLPDDELTLRTNATAAANARAGTIRLYVDRNDSTPERGLVAELSSGLSGSPRKLVELDGVVTTLDVRYLSGLHGARDWSTSWVSTTVLPLGVEIRLTSAPTDSLAPLLRLPLLVALEGAR